MNDEPKSSILDVLSGRDSIKIDFNFDLYTIAIIFGAVLLAGIILIYANKKIS